MILSLLLACAGDPADTQKRPRQDDTAGDTAGDTARDSQGETGDTSRDTSADSGESGEDSGEPVTVEPPLGGSSGGSGGSDAPSATSVTVGGVTYQLLAPTGSASGRGVPLLLVFSGTEGANAMMSNMKQVARYAHLDDALVAVLDGQRSDAADGEAVLDDVRASFDVDNDRTWLLSESAGTTAGLQLGFHRRQSWFAAYWANDVNARDTPGATASELGVAPWGNAGPGGDDADAQAIVDGMRDAGYQLPADAPYSGAGSDTHGSTEQFLEAVSFFHDKRRD